MSKEMAKAYEPVDYEDKIYENWEKSGYFNPDNLDLPEDAPTYSIVMPPPNVTGVLHIGHASMLALEDILTRYHRMKGDRALWLPGTDHASIATQTKVEKIIKEKGESRHSLGREEFLKRVREFAQGSHDTIVNQVKKMGSSCDWSREAYTLDATREKAVNSVFKLMYDDGLIYRGERIVNWCPRCHSTLADDEVEYKEQKAKLYAFKYDKSFPAAISTTRPETKLGDTAVAVNPKDERYKNLIGQTFEVDFVGVPLKIKIIADRNVDMEFGTGALGVTPAHSHIDWQMAEENELEKIKVIDEDGKIYPDFGQYGGKTAKEAREMIVENLKKAGLMEEEEEIDNKLSLCYRCDTPVEPLPSLQWFIDVNKKITRNGNLEWNDKSIKEICLEAVKEGKINIVPERFEKNYYHWMENLRDWCISRQIWFGHQVPVWYGPAAENRKQTTDDRNSGNIELILVRHGQTDWNRDGIMQGQKDIPLNAKGEKDARELAEKLKNEKIDIVISSPLSRTRKTAELLNVFGLEIAEDERLKERGYGKFEGLKTAQILAEHPEIKTFEKNGLPYWISVPTAETYEEVRARAKDFLDDIKKKYAGKRILVVSHGDTLDMLYAELNNIPDEEAYGRFFLNTKAVRHKIEISGNQIYVGAGAPSGKGWTRDPDTLDTWFSSGLWTFSTLARSPEEVRVEDGRLVIDSDDFKRYHPTAVLETGYDILFFWVARMIIMTTYAVGDIPFKDVYLHGLVLDEKGKKMSKSKGNVIDPLDMIPKYGTDAVRMSLVIGSSPGNDLRISEEKIAGFRNLVNKIWNVARFITQNSQPKAGPPWAEKLITHNSKFKIDNVQLSAPDKWVLSKFNLLIKGVTDDLENYRFSQAGEKLRSFTWDDLADWYLEACKFEDGEEKEKVLYYILKNLLKLWHPFMPFVTEAIWTQMGEEKMLIVENWPKPEFEISDADDFEIAKDVITAIRNARSLNKVEPAKKIKAVLRTDKHYDVLKNSEPLIKRMRTGIEDLAIEDKRGEDLPDSIYSVVNGIDIYLLGAIDKEKEGARMSKEIEKLKKLIDMTEKKLANEEFIAKAPAPIVEKEKGNLAQWKEELGQMEEKVKNL